MGTFGRCYLGILGVLKKVLILGLVPTRMICNATVYEVQLIRAVAAERNCSLNMSIGSIATGAT